MTPTTEMKGATLEDLMEEQENSVPIFSTPKFALPAFIDGDLVAYRASAAAEGRLYTVRLGKKKVFETKYMKEAKAYCTKKDIHFSNIHKTLIPEPESHAIHNVESTLDTIAKAYSDYQLIPHLFVSGNTNFREDVYPDYKANRVGTARPTHLEACKQHLVTKYGAKIAEGCEADDMISIAAHEARKEGKEAYVIVTLDKDFDMIPGEHYNWVKDKKYETNEWEGKLIFYRQLLTGDSVDNIPGLHKVGPKTAEKWLPFPELGELLWTDGDMYAAVLDRYLMRLGKDEEETEEEYIIRVVKTVTRNAQLLWLQTTEGELWQPPRLPKEKRIKEYLSSGKKSPETTKKKQPPTSQEWVEAIKTLGKQPQR